MFIYTRLTFLIFGLDLTFVTCCQKVYLMCLFLIISTRSGRDVCKFMFIYLDRFLASLLNDTWYYSAEKFLIRFRMF